MCDFAWTSVLWSVEKIFSTKQHPRKQYISHIVSTRENPMLSWFASALRCFAWNHELPSMQTAHDKCVFTRVPGKVPWFVWFAAWKCFKWPRSLIIVVSYVLYVAYPMQATYVVNSPRFIIIRYFPCSLECIFTKKTDCNVSVSRKQSIIWSEE